MKHVLYTCSFSGVDDTTKDGKISLSYLKSGGVTICIHKGDAIVFDATISAESWQEMISEFTRCREA